jgi:5'-nucleotidase
VRERVFSVDGTPTDCVNIAITKVLKAKPDLVVSGINKGYNIGDDVTYSGTVAGALEGALLGIPSVAVSLERTRELPDFAQAAEAAALVAAAVLEHGLPIRTLLNINVPRMTAKGIEGDRAGQAQPRHVGGRSHGSAGPAVLLDRGRAEASGSRTTGPTTRRCGTATSR